MTKNKTKKHQKCIDINRVELDFSSKKFLNGFCHIKSHFNLKSSLLKLNFSVWLSVKYTLNTMYLAQKHKNMLQKFIDPN